MFQFCRSVLSFFAALVLIATIVDYALQCEKKKKDAKIESDKGQANGAFESYPEDGEPKLKLNGHTETMTDPVPSGKITSMTLQDTKNEVKKNSQF